MSEENKPVEPPVVEPDNHHSVLFGISLRGWIAAVIVLTICVMSVLSLEVKEPLYTLGGMVIGYYYAQSKKTP